MEKHKGNSFKCKECGKIWESAKELYDHSNRVHREKLSCQNSGNGCEYKTKDKKLLAKHEGKCVRK